jgi:hypothetical protein
MEAIDHAQNTHCGFCRRNDRVYASRLSLGDNGWGGNGWGDNDEIGGAARYRPGSGDGAARHQRLRQPRLRRRPNVSSAQAPKPPNAAIATHHTL